VGDHATYHKRYDAPLESDIDALAHTVSGWVRRSAAARDVGADTAEAITAATASPGRVATLILPADVSWTDGAEPGQPQPASAPEAPAAAEAVDLAATILRSGEPAMLLLGHDATGQAGLIAASRIAEATGARLLCETFPTRLARGAGLPAVERLGYFAEAAEAQLDGVKHLILAGARAPVSFFAYPGKPSDLVPAGCAVHTLAEPGQASAALVALADDVAADAAPTLAALRRPPLPTGALTGQAIAEAVGALLPEHAIVVDESNTAGLALPAATAGAPPHDWLTLTGGAIGYGLPNAVGAAIAAPDRRVLCLQADGSAMYTPAALWTMAREQLDVTTVIYNNGAYDILRLELQRVGAQSAGGVPGPRAEAMLDLDPPRMDFVAMATGMGVPARRATTAEEFTAALADALAASGPRLIDAVIPSLMGGA
ncbi:MAG: acetolactate synthase large subunit, partial [Mycobacteriaceae bacterium]|nr:acetolactate synthase large subunit [Mycobacteriaceae bacterium]